MPPIFQPEVAAEAIVYAAHSKRREIYVGMPTVEAIVANKIAPALLDRYLGGTEMIRSKPPRRWRPAGATICGARCDDDHDHGAHGSFDSCARRRSIQLLGRISTAGLIVLGAIIFPLSSVFADALDERLRPKMSIMQRV